MAVNVTETETKYDAPAAVTLPDLHGLPQVAATSGPDEVELDAEYYDTDDLRLLRAGITLRRRHGGGDAGWHLKLSAGGDTRREIRLPLGRTGRRVPAELAELVRVHTRGEPRSTPSVTSRCSMTWTGCWTSPRSPRRRRCRPPRRSPGRRGGPTGRLRRAPVHERGRGPGDRREGPPVRQAGEKGPVGAR